MAKNSFPQTTQPPIQQIHFFLSDAQKSRIIVQLEPQPAPGGNTVGDVVILASVPGDIVLLQLLSPAPLTVINAAMRACQYANQHAQNQSVTIAEVKLQGEEFVEVSDLVQILPSGTPINVF